MDLKEMKTNAKYLPGIFLAVMIVSALVTVTKVAAYQISAKNLPAKIEKAAVINNAEDETVQKLIAISKEAADNLKKKNMFVPPAPKPEQPTCIGIFGDQAIFGDKTYRVGDEIAGAKILEIGGHDVTIEWEGNQVKLVPFAKENAGSSPGKGPGKGPSSGAKPSPQQGTPQPGGERRMDGPPSGRFGGFQISDEQRQQMMEMRQRYENASPEERERMREEFRSRMGFGGRGPGGGDRGGDRGSSGGRGGRGR